MKSWWEIEITGGKNCSGNCTADKASRRVSMVRAKGIACLSPQKALEYLEITVDYLDALGNPNPPLHRWTRPVRQVSV